MTAVIGLIAATIGMFIALATDVIASRIGVARIVAYGASLATGFLGTLLAAFVLVPAIRIDVFGVAALAYGAWWFAFLNLVQALASSLRVRLLQEVRAAGGRMSRAKLRQRYNDNTLLSLRLDRLLNHGAVVERDGRLYVASPGLKRLARFFRILKKTLTGRISEFGAPPT